MRVTGSSTLLRKWAQGFKTRKGAAGKAAALCHPSKGTEPSAALALAIRPKTPREPWAGHLKQFLVPVGRARGAHPQESNSSRHNPQRTH